MNYFFTQLHAAFLLSLLITSAGAAMDFNKGIELENDLTVSPAHALVCLQDTRLLASLLELENMDLDKPDSRDGFTPLICAVELDNPEAARLLLHHGANPALYDHYGLRPYDHIRLDKNPENAAKNKELRTLFESFGAHLFAPIGLNSDYESDWEGLDLTHLPQEKKEYLSRLANEFIATSKGASKVRKWALQYGALKVPYRPCSQTITVPTIAIPFNEERFNHLSVIQRHIYLRKVILYLENPKNTCRIPSLLKTCKEYGFLK